MTLQGANKFLQIAVNVTPSKNFTENLAGVTKKWNVALFPTKPGGSDPAGRGERRGSKPQPPHDVDPMLQAPRFRSPATAPLPPEPNMPGMTLPPNFLSRACFNADFMDGVITETTKEIEVFVKTKGATVGPTIAAVAAVAAIATAGAALAILLTALLAILPILALLLLLIRAQGNPLRLGQVMNDVQQPS